MLTYTTVRNILFASLVFHELVVIFFAVTRNHNYVRIIMVRNAVNWLTVCTCRSA